MNRIIVGYDGSELARAAFAYGVMLAESANTAILAVAVVEEPPSTVVPVDPASMATEIIPPSPEARAEARECAEERLRGLKDFAFDQHLEFTTQVCEGPFVEAMRRIEREDDLLCVGAHGRFATAGLGSSTRALVKAGRCPLLVAPGPLRTINRVVTPYDGTPQSEHAVRWGQELARQAGWPQTILAVSDVRMSLDEALQRSQDLVPEASVVHYGPEHQSEAAQIEETVRHMHYGLLVMGAFPDNPIHQLFFGGTTGHVLRHVDAPVVLVR